MRRVSNTRAERRKKWLRRLTLVSDVQICNESRRDRQLPIKFKTRSRVMKDTMEGQIKSVTDDAENFVRETGSGLSEKAREARARLAASLASAKAGLSKLNEKAVEGAKATDKVIRANPYQSIGIAFGLGILIGVLVTRNRD
jgi:ElaB/YqjD/DUF883 family membrane-anchored ribosome-binding protein